MRLAECGDFGVLKKGSTQGRLVGFAEQGVGLGLHNEKAVVKRGGF